MAARHVVFVGAGHAHLYALARVHAYAAAGLEVTLVTPGRFWYSGMGPGLVGGRYTAADDTVDVGRLVERAGGRHVAGVAETLDLASGEVVVAGGPRLPFDLVSLNVGSEVPLERIPGAADDALPAKPIENLVELRARWTRSPARGPERVLVVGGGPAGCEIAGNAAAALVALGVPGQVTLAASRPRLLASFPARAGRLAAAALRGLGVAVPLGSPIAAIEPAGARFASGERLPFDSLVVATGVRPPAWLARTGLPLAADGSLVVDAALRSPADPRVFGAGDAVAFRGTPLPRIGVHAVRQAPVLHRNLLKSAAGRPLDAYRPQRRTLLLLNLGDGSALLTWGPVALRGRWALRLKDRIDRRFVRRAGEAIADVSRA